MQRDHIMWAFPCDQSLPSLKADHLKYSFSIFQNNPFRDLEDQGVLLFLTQTGWLDFEFFR